MVISDESIKYSLRNLRMRKSRSLLTILSIFVGISSIFIFVSFGWGLFDYVNEFTTSSSVDKIIIQAKGGGMPGLDDTFKLTDDDIEAIDRVPGVLSVTGSTFAVSEVMRGSEKKFTFIMAFDPKNPMVWDLSNVGLLEGRELLSSDTKKVVLGYNYLVPDKIFSKPLALNDVIEIQGIDMKVVGFMEAIGNPQDDAQVYVNNEYFKEVYPLRNDSYSWIIARVEVENIGRIVDDVEKALRKHRDLEKGKEDFFVQSFDEMIESYSSALNIIIGFVILIAFISVIVSAVNTANTMITSVIERTKEIGVIKSIGARNSEILKIFLFESSFLGCVAGIIGVLVGFALTSFADALLESLGWGFLSPHYSWILFVGCVAFATTTGALSGIIPAIRAARINTVDALRYE